MYYSRVCSQGVFLTEALAEFQHVKCMIVRIWEVKRVACYAMLGLKLLLRQLPWLPLWYSYALAITSSVCATRIRTEVLGGGALSFQNKIFVHASN